jgi:hypothetical protein
LQQPQSSPSSSPSWPPSPFCDPTHPNKPQHNNYRRHPSVPRPAQRQAPPPRAPPARTDRCCAGRTTFKCPGRPAS